MYNYVWHAFVYSKLWRPTQNLYLSWSTPNSKYVFAFGLQWNHIFYCGSTGRILNILIFLFLILISTLIMRKYLFLYSALLIRLMSRCDIIYLVTISLSHHSHVTPMCPISLALAEYMWQPRRRSRLSVSSQLSHGTQVTYSVKFQMNMFKSA